MKLLYYVAVCLVFLSVLQTVSAQPDSLDMELEVTDEEKIILFTGFAVAVIALFLFLARDVLLRRKTAYDKKEFESKKDKTYEKYHLGWGDDYEEVGSRKKYDGGTVDDFFDAVDATAADDSRTLGYYDVLGVSEDATQETIKGRYRELVKRTHPDKTKNDSEKEMVRINKAYEVLSDQKNRGRYDMYLKRRDKKA